MRQTQLGKYFLLGALLALLGCGGSTNTGSDGTGVVPSPDRLRSERSSCSAEAVACSAAAPATKLASARSGDWSRSVNASSTSCAPAIASADSPMLMAVAVTLLRASSSHT